MESLYILVPLSVLLILAVLGVFAWALKSGQFDDLNREGERILQKGPMSIDERQGRGVTHVQSSFSPSSEQERH